MNPERHTAHSGYSRVGTAVFLLTMAFPFVALGWKLAGSTPLSFGLYVALVMVLALAAAAAIRLAPTLREREPAPKIDINTLYDSEKHGVPW